MGEAAEVGREWNGWPRGTRQRCSLPALCVHVGHDAIQIESSVGAHVDVAPFRLELDVGAVRDELGHGGDGGGEAAEEKRSHGGHGEGCVLCVCVCV